MWARRSVGEGGVAAGDEAFPGVVGVADLGEVRLVEQGLLQGPVRDGQGGDRGGAEGGDPAEAAELAELPNTGGSDHAAACDHDHLLDAEHGFHLNGDLLERGRVGRVPRHHPDRDRPPGRVGQQPVFDLREAFSPVARVTPGRQLAVRPGRL